MTQRPTYEEIYRSFQWKLPEQYNMAHDVCDRHAQDPSKVALLGEDTDGKRWQLTFRDVQLRANRLANLLVALGLSRGDRVMLLLGQDPWTAIAHVACWKAGLVSVPASVLFAADAIAYRLQHVGVRVVITDSANLPKVIACRDKAPTVEKIFLVDGRDSLAESLDAAVEFARDSFTNVVTGLRDPAFLNFTSGTTGNPKGALQAHSCLLGHMPCMELSLNFFPQPGDLMWTAADWAWLAGLMPNLMTAWYHGVPVLVYRAQKFDPEQALWMMGRYNVRTSLLTATMLRLMRQVKDPVGRLGVRMRAIASGGEAVGKELHEWAAEVLQTPINEVFGQTECNVTLGNNSLVMPLRPGSMGRAMPGHIAGVVDDAGNELPDGTTGNLAFKRPDPVMMLEYWNNPEATRTKYANDWLITGDLATRDGEGYYWFQGRADDIITSSGYRIGPTEIEDALTRHDAVVLAAAIGVPDPVRTETIKAFVVLREDFAPTPALVEEIRASVRDHLAKHEVPREIEFVSSLPTTTTGKILRRVLRDAEKAKREATSG